MQKILIFFCVLVLSACSSTHVVTSAPKTPATPTAPTFRVAFGSCNNQDEPQSFYQLILQKNPQVWVWLGDNIYGDTKSPRVLATKYKKLIDNPEYKAFALQLRITGTWDDHDYGDNDAGSEFPLKRYSKNIFWDFMGVPSESALRLQDGVYRSEIWDIGSKKVKLINLDTRYNRDPLIQNSYHEYIPTEGDMLGEAQWMWLEKELTDASDFDAVVIANGTQVLSDKHRFEKWANFPKSRTRLLKLLEDSPIPKKVLISGDRHFGEISQIILPSGALVTEVTSSGLTHSYENVDEDNSYRFGKLWPKTHYALMDFYDEKDDLRIVFSIQDLSTNNEVNRLELKGDSHVPSIRGT